METTLNLIWVAVTIAAVWLWRFRWSVSRENRRHSMRMESVAMVCVLALLFPVISLTDDLHPETVAVDASSGKRNACLMAVSSPHVRNATIRFGKHFTVGLISRPFDAANLVISEFLAHAHFEELSSIVGNSRGRSPPTL
jgi:ABC-type uncharacterized transport system permease subunit